MFPATMNFLYAVIIFPIEQVIEVIYTLIYKIFEVPGISVIGVSFAVTFLSLPLYIIAEKWQEAERRIINRLKPKADKIKQAFKGDEQYMILSAYYRQNGYHPIYSLRNSLNMLIQIPFFIAAYHFLSNFSALQGAPFLFIADMGKPDALFKLSGFSINALPVLMTAINCISGVIYTKKLELRDKLQVYALALIFLVLLYNSPAGLVLYWTMNNILSLIKNIFYRLKNPIKVLYVIICVFLILFILYLLFLNDGELKKRLILALFCFVMLFIPLLYKLYIRLQNHFLIPLIEADRKRTFLFFISSVVLTLLAGFLIPSSVIASSPEEFSFIDAYQSPLPFILITFFKSAGLFIFWPFCIYFLFGKKVQDFLTLFFLTAVTAALLNTFVFQGKFSTISNTFIYNDDSLNALNSSKAASILTIFLILAFFAVFLFLIKHKCIKIISTSLVLLFFSLTVLCVHNIFIIQKSYTNLAALGKTELSGISRMHPVFHLSKNKPNIIIIMADKAINGFVKPIFDEQPDLYNQFEGFTLFPNTVSFARFTIMGAPPIWGGYEYTPREMNRRDTIPLVDKHNEALLVLPKILSETGYQVTVTDPSFANYASTNDIGIFGKYENIKAFNTIGRYTNLWCSLVGIEAVPVNGAKIIRNALWFSFLKICPLFMRKIVYDDGKYWEIDKRTESIDKFLNSYAVLDFLPNLTAYDSEKSSALLITNEITHEPVFLQYPSYTPVRKVTDIGNGRFSNDSYYHVNSAFYQKIGKWLEELKNNYVYDNSRIIIVSDHGTNLNAGIADTELTIPDERREGYNPVLLYKDFNSTGKLRTDMTFMTNADVPVLALDGVAQAINPFSGKSLRENPKAQGLYITTNPFTQPHRHGKRTFNIDADEWLFVHDNIFDPNNWEKAEK
jgi:YidC/Oxa1 family membrane protein insertase